MRKFSQIMQIAFTYMGTIVGAGFASGQEILQFFTQHGRIAALTIVLATVLFIWIGCKVMLLSNQLGGQSYEDLNKVLFGPQVGKWISLFMMFVLLGTSTVMLAGAGSLFSEQLFLSYQTGLLVTMVLTYWILSRGIHAILKVNAFIVPLMLVFTAIIVWSTWQMPNSGSWINLTTDSSLPRIWFAPILYVAFNLASAQAVLIPLGSTIKDRSILYWGGLVGGIGIGLMLLAAHYALSAQMPGIRQFEIPMGHIIERLGTTIQLMFVLIIFGEILSTFLVDVYGLTLQLQQKIRLPQKAIIVIILFVSYAISHIGFSVLLSTLYPLFGFISLIWFAMMIFRRESRTLENL